MTLKETVDNSKLIYAAAWIVGFIWGIKQGFHKSYTEAYVRNVLKHSRTDLANAAILKYEKLRNERGYAQLNI